MRGGKIDSRYQEGLPIRDTATAKSYCIFADLLIPGRGDPIKSGCVIVEGGKITFAGEQKETGPEHADLPNTHVKVLMPGMWDCHVHLMGLQSMDNGEFITGAHNQALLGARIAKDVSLLLNSGFTSVREMAGYGLQIAQGVKEGSIVGPNIYSSNNIISMTGGHADIHTLHKPWYDDAGVNGMPSALADGVPECLKAVRMQLRAGANVIKICGSGGVGSERDNPVDQQFSGEEMRAIVEEAARAQRIVGAHCHGKPGIMTALRSGVKTIEHGSFIDEEAADLMLEKGAILVATRLIVANGLALGGKYWAPYAYEKLKVIAGAHWEAMQLAIRKGVTTAIGTDTCGTTPGSQLLRFDRCGKELYYHVKAGMSPLKAIEAATANGPLTLGPQAPKSGVLWEGYDADFIALDENPLDDIGVLTGPDHVTHVWKGGKLYKSPGHPVSIL